MRVVGHTYTTVDLLLLRLSKNKNRTAYHFKRDEEVDAHVAQVYPLVAICDRDHDTAGVRIVQMAKLGLRKAYHFCVDVDDSVDCADQD